MKRDPKLCYPLVEGLFYPGEKEALLEEVDSLIGGAESDSPALITPHAAYRITGESCGRAWSCSSQRPVTRILLLAPVHREPEPFGALPPFERFASPLGEIETDGEILSQLKQATPLFREDRMPFEEEHSTELSLPFISRLFPEAKIIPLLTGNLRRREIKEMGKALRQVLYPIREELLTVISTNLSRFITPEVSRREADNFVRFIRNEPLGEKDRKEISACGIHCLELFREIDLYRGEFTEICRFEREKKENRKTASLHYGAYSFTEEGTL